MLPDGFRWQLTHIGADGAETVLALDGTGVARLIDRLDGGWFVLLDYHRDVPRPPRHCTSFEAGKAGAEAWAQRHEARLRAEVKAKREAWLATQTWRPHDDSPCEPGA